MAKRKDENELAKSVIDDIIGWRESAAEPGSKAFVYAFDRADYLGAETG